MSCAAGPPGRGSQDRLGDHARGGAGSALGPWELRISAQVRGRVQPEAGDHGQLVHSKGAAWQAFVVPENPGPGCLVDSNPDRCCSRVPRALLSGEQLGLGSFASWLTLPCETNLSKKTNRCHLVQPFPWIT